MEAEQTPHRDEDEVPHDEVVTRERHHDVGDAAAVRDLREVVEIVGKEEDADDASIDPRGQRERDEGERMPANGRHEGSRTRGATPGPGGASAGATSRWLSGVSGSVARQASTCGSRSMNRTTCRSTCPPGCVSRNTPARPGKNRFGM